ncbi:hypothetical protein DD237_000373 [Peronospora effusa]|uniref:TsaA-like domain-containing protein n=1 Tax=Peronospora effusa TaxID=542832 RepID=A0A425BWQ2_9STRA|nr:hypothetical protein DD237_000373 [Peronospora effusa]
MPFGIKLEAVVLTLQVTTLLWILWRQLQPLSDISDLNQIIQKLERDLAKNEKARAEERRGRIAAEKELRRVMEEKLDTKKACFVQPVGTVRSCFKECLGTPRQGSLAPSTRAQIIFQRSISPDTLCGLEDFSHVWIVFVFHQNTNGKNTRAHEGLRSDSHRHTFRAKISPPMLKERVGIFCTRSPHRPNPIGITLAKIEHVDIRKRTHLRNETCFVITRIEWESDMLKSAIHKLSRKSVHYRNAPDHFVAAIEEVLQVDVRSKYQTRRWTSPDYINYQIVDNIRVKYRFALLPQPSLSMDSENDIDTAHIQIFAVDESITIVES